MASRTTIEFSVDLTCQNCVQKTRKALTGVDGIESVAIDLDKQSVVVKTDLSTGKVQELIESTGKKAVAVGVGGATGNLGAAVAAVGGALGAFRQGQEKPVQGVVRFIQLDENTCAIDGTIDHLTPNGEHAISIHESGDLSLGCDSVGGHFNPRKVRHGSPENGEDERHVGDLGNIRADETGRARFRLTDKLVKVWDIIGRSVVVAEGRDDLGLGDHQRSSIDGNCGKGLSCGIIARSAGIFQNSSKKFCACDGVPIWDERNVPNAGGDRTNTDKH